jgi:hypothetical protein
VKPMDLLEALGELPEEYIVRELDYEPPRKHTAFLVSKPFLAGASTAACLLLIVGLGVGVWSRQQKIQTRPPQETQTTTVTQTETRTETTAQVTTESQTTRKQTETSRKATGTTIVQPEVIVSSTASVLTTIMTVATSIERTTTVAAIQTPLTETVTLTIPVMTTVPTVSIYEWHYGTIPPRGTKYSTANETTQTMITISTELTEPITTMTSETTSPSERLPGFQISEPDSNNIVKINYQNPLSPSPTDFLIYTFSSEVFQITSQSMPMADYQFLRYYYTIESNDGTGFYIMQEERDSFSIEAYADSEITYSPVNGHPGLFYIADGYSFLWWDDGSYKFLIRLKHQSDTEKEEREMMLQLAESLVQTENTL